MSGETLDKMYIALVGEFSRFTREQYAKRIEALGGIICEPKNDIDYIFYGKLPIDQIHEFKYGLETVFGAYNEIALLDKLTEVEMDKQDRLPLSRIEYYQTLPTQPEGCTVFMYEVRRMAQELAELRERVIDQGTGTPCKKEAGELVVDLKNSGGTVTLGSLTNQGIDYFRQTLDGEYVKDPDGFKLKPLSTDLLRDAMRWRAFINTPAIRFFGSAGLKEGRKVSGYAHFGAEFWTIHSGRVFSSEESVKNRELLTEYADILVDNVARKADQKISVIIDNLEWLNDNSEAWFEGVELKMDIPLKEILPVITEWRDTAGILQRAETAATERGIWQPVTLRITGKEPKE